MAQPGLTEPDGHPLPHCQRSRYFYKPIMALGIFVPNTARRLLRSLDEAPWVVPVLAACLQAGLFWYAHAHYYLGNPTTALPTDSWWNWPDQSHYLSAAVALAEGDLSPSRFWYEPGYSILAAGFTRFRMADPFFVPDAACYILSGWLSARLGSVLLGGRKGAAPLSALCFIATTAWRPTMLEIWVVPWTTTATAPLILGALLAAIRFAERPRPVPCFLAAFLACCIAFVRPSDLPVIAGPTSVFLLATLSERRLAGQRIRLATAGILGGALALAAALLVHIAIWGVHLGPYIEQSRQIGFEWALIPLRWVLLVCGPKPLLTDGEGLAQMFPWFIPGTAGAVAALLSPGTAGRKTHALVIAALAGQVLLMLSYRDLHPTGLWRFANYHYFKFVIPTLGLYALFLLTMLFEPRRRPHVLPAAAIAAVLFLWRPALEKSAGSLTAQIVGPHSLSLTNRQQSIGNGVVVPANATWVSIVMGPDTGNAGDAAIMMNVDFKTYPQPNGLLLVPLGPLPPQFRIDFNPGVTFQDGDVPISVRQRLVFGLPCWLRTCPGSYLLPAKRIPLGQPVPLDMAAEPYVAGGWFYAEPHGRWTDGPDARLRVAVALPEPGHPLTLRLNGFGRLLPGRDVARIDVLANGRPLGQWRPNSGPGQHFSAQLPAGVLTPDQDLVIDLHVENPRSLHPFTDPRRLGIFVESFEVDAE